MKKLILINKDFVKSAPYIVWFVLAVGQPRTLTPECPCLSMLCRRQGTPAGRGLIY